MLVLEVSHINVSDQKITELLQESLFYCGVYIRQLHMTTILFQFSRKDEIYRLFRK